VTARVDGGLTADRHVGILP